MAEVKVFYDKVGNTLTVWFSDPNLEHVSEETGDEVVLMKDSAGKIIYIGKAQNLQKRVSSYFQNSRDNYFYQQIHSFNTIITNNVKIINVVIIIVFIS